MSPSHRKPLPPTPTMQPGEVPEKRREYTKESLLKFKDEKAAMDEAEKLAAAGLGEGGFFGGFGGGGDEGEGGEEKEKGEEGTEKSTIKASREVRAAKIQHTSDIDGLFCRRLTGPLLKKRWFLKAVRLCPICLLRNNSWQP